MNCRGKEEHKMGGEPRKQEPSNCREWKENSFAWEILQKRKVMTYIERLHGYKPHITEIFFKIWFEERITLHGVIVNFLEEFISKL